MYSGRSLQLQGIGRRSIRGMCLLLATLCLSACGATFPNRVPVGEHFPSVRGTSLTGRSHRVPDDFAGTPLLLFVGYEQKTQFDIDRWTLGVRQLKTPVRIVELPILLGFFPNLFSKQIDQSMRDGIPRQDWSSVVTVYEGGEIVQIFTGNENKNIARVLLLDVEGQVVWFSHDGYSATQMTALDEVVRALRRSLRKGRK